MKQPSVQNISEEQLLIETEKELKKNVDELMVWLGGTINYFIRSIKGLSELSKDKTHFRSYVSERLFDHIGRLSKVANDYMPGATRKNGKKLTAKEIKEDIQNSLNGFDIDPSNHEELSVYYKNVISGILSENYEEFSSMRLQISAMKFVSKTCDEYGSAILNYMCEHILLTQNMPLGQRIGNLLCLVMSVKEVDSKLFGNYAECIDTVIDQATVTVCMSVTTDFINSKKQEDE